MKKKPIKFREKLVFDDVEKVFLNEENITQSLLKLGEDWLDSPTAS